MAKQNLPNESSTNNNLVSEKNYYLYLLSIDSIQPRVPRSKPSNNHGVANSTETYLSGYFENQGQEGLLLILKDVLKDYLFVAEDLNDFTTNFNNLSDSIATSIEDIDAKINQLYKTNAEQNLQLWELQAQIINDKESMLGWQGDGFFSNQNEIADTPTNMTILRGETLTDTTSRILFGNPDPDDWEALPNRVLTTNVTALDYSPNNKYLAVGVSGGYLHILKRDGESYITVKSVVLGISVKGVAFSPDNNYVAVSHTSSPYVTIFKQTSEDVFTALPAPGALPTGAAYGVAFDQSGAYLAVAHAITPFVTIYKRTEDAFNKIANPSTLPLDTCCSASFGTDSITNDTYLALATKDDSYGIVVYRRSSGDAFTKLTTPSLGAYANGNSVSFTSDGVYLAIGFSIAPYTTVFKRTDATTISNLGTPSGSAITYAVKFSPDNNYLIMGNSSNSYSKLYSRSGDNFTPIEISNGYSVYQTDAIAITSDNSYVAFGSLDTGSKNIYLRATTKEFLTPTSGSLITKSITLPEISNSIFFLEESSIDAGVSLKYEVSLDGGTTWEEVTKFGEVVVLGHTGTELVINASYTRDISGVGIGYIEWFVCWGGVS